MFYTYVLESQYNGSWYIGYTVDPGKRVKTHNAGGNVSTKRYRPWKLIYYEAYLVKADALGREHFLKSGSGRTYLKKQMKNYVTSLQYGSESA